MSKMEELAAEMLSHLQAALTAIEVTLLTGSTDMLPVAQREIVAGCKLVEAAVADRPGDGQ